MVSPQSRYATRMRAKQACLLLAPALFMVVLSACLPGCTDLEGPEQAPTGAATAGESTGAEPRTAESTTTTLSEAATALGRMTLREKAAQVLLVSFSGTELEEQTADLLAAGPPGGVLIFRHNVSDPTQMKELTSGLQQTAAATGSPVGLFVAVDQEGGRVQRIKQGVPELPSAREMGTEATAIKAHSLALDTAQGLLDQGINMNLAPVADVVDDEDSFLYSRTYSGDPDVVSEFVVAVIEAHAEQGLISVVKHFPGHGSSSGDTHAGVAISGATERGYEKVHLPPFRAAISAGVDAVMTAHIVASPYDKSNPASLSQTVIEKLLREELGFKGLVVADDVSMAAILDHVASELDSSEALGVSTSHPGTTEPAPERTEEQLDELTQEEIEERIRIENDVRALVAALNAGCDLLILTELETRAQAVLDGLVDAIRQGEVAKARLDEAVLRVLELKYRYGIIAVKEPQPTTTITEEEGR